MKGYKAYKGSVMKRIISPFTALLLTVILSITATAVFMVHDNRDDKIQKAAWIEENASHEVTPLSPVVYETLRKLSTVQIPEAQVTDQEPDTQSGPMPVTMSDWYGVPYERLRDDLKDLYIPTEAEVKKLTQCMYGEDRGPNITSRAAVAWCVLNRIDAGNDFENTTTISKAINPGQFEGYSPYNPVWTSLQNLAIDVISRWLSEKIGCSDIGRVLPAEYTFFSSDGHLHNVFRTTWHSWDQSCKFYDWSLPSPYDADSTGSKEASG